MTFARATDFAVGIAIGAAICIAAIAEPIASRDLWTWIGVAAAPPPPALDQLRDSAIRSPFDPLGGSAFRAAAAGEDDHIVGELHP